MAYKIFHKGKPIGKTFKTKKAVTNYVEKQTIKVNKPRVYKQGKRYLISATAPSLKGKRKVFKKTFKLKSSAWRYLGRAVGKTTKIKKV